jgi:hypothetical protein
MINLSKKIKDSLSKTSEVELKNNNNNCYIKTMAITSVISLLYNFLVLHYGWRIGEKKEENHSDLGTNTIDLEELQSRTIISATGVTWHPFVSHLWHMCKTLTLI